MAKNKKTYKEHKTHVQAWLIHDPNIDPEQALAVQIWKEEKQKHKTSAIMTRALIAYREKEGEGFRPVRDDTPKLAQQLRESIHTLKEAVGKLANLNLQSVSSTSDMQTIMGEVSDAANAIDFNIISDSMTFDED